MACPTCGKPAKPREDKNQAFPFCSDRCRMADLARWLNEEYRIPAEEPGDASGATVEDEEASLPLASRSPRR